MYKDQGASTSTPPDQAIPPTSNQNIELQDGQTLGIEALSLTPGNLTPSLNSRPISTHTENVTNQSDQMHEAPPPDNLDEELLVRSPSALRMEARALLRLITILGGNDDGQSDVHRTISARLIAIEERLRQLVFEIDDDVQLMDEEALQAEGLRLMIIAQGDEDGRVLSHEDADAINRRSNSVNARLREIRRSPMEKDDEEKSPRDLQLMSLYDLDDEYERLVEEFKVKANEDPSHEDLRGIQRRHRQVMNRQRELTRFPSDNSEEIFGEDHIPNIMLCGGNLPRFLFRGSNSRSGGNESDSAPSSSDDGISVRSQTVRMINEEDRIVPHAHFADPTMLNHPRRQNLNALQEAADWHTSARRFNTPFTSWSCDFETALYFAIGHYPNENEPEALEEAGLRNDWVFHDADVVAEIAVIDTWTIPDRHLRVFHQPSLLLDPDAPAIPTEFLIYGTLDRADGVDLRGVSIQELRARARCPTWPYCLSRNQLPHQPTLQDISEAWTIARAFMQDNMGGEEEEEEEEEEEQPQEEEQESMDLGLAVLAGELARQQWAGFPPRPDAHVVEAQVQIQWPGAWMRRIRRRLERIVPGPLGPRMSGMPLANVGTPYMGFPQFRLMQQLLLSWVMDYPSDLVSDESNDDEEEAHVVLPLRHSCDNPTLLDTLTELQLATFQSQMVKRDRDGHVSVPPPRGYRRDFSEDETTDQVAVEDSTTEYASAEDEPDTAEDTAMGDGPLEDVLADESPIESIEPIAEADLQTQGNTEQQQPERGAEREVRDMPENPVDDRPHQPQDRLGLRGGGYQEWEEEVPFTVWRVLVLIIAFLFTAIYFVLALAVYE